MHNSQTVVDRIKEVIKHKGVSQKQMLSDLGMSVNTIQHIGKGQEISYVAFERIADYLECSVDYLLGRTDTPDSGNSELLSNLTAEQRQDVIEYVQFLKWRGKAG